MDRWVSVDLDLFSQECMECIEYGIGQGKIGLVWSGILQDNMEQDGMGWNGIDEDR